MLVCVSFVHCCTRDRGCSAHPVFPAPSYQRVRKFLAKLGRIAPRDREFISSRHRRESGQSSIPEIHGGSSAKMSVRTFESTSVMGLFPAQHRHYLVGGRTGTGAATKLLKTAQRARLVGSFDNDAAVGGAPEGNLDAGFQTQVVADPLRDRYAAIARDLGWHRGLRIRAFGLIRRKVGKISSFVDG